MDRRVSLLTVMGMVMLLALLPTITGIAFDQSVTINNGLPVFTDDTILCEWNATPDVTAQNITFYRDGALYNSTYQTSGFSSTASVSSGATTKNEVWRCNITLYNATGVASEEVNITIQNSAPETPVIYNSTNEDIGTEYNVSEDTTYLFDVNSSDADNDTLYYYFKSQTQGFCTMSDTAEGIASCTPLFENLVNNSITQVNITFWVDDDDLIKAKSASLKVSFRVYPVNDAPTATVPDQTINVTDTLEYNITGADEENNTPYNFSLQSVPSEISNKVSLRSSPPDGAVFVYNGSSPDFNDVNESGWPIVINISDSDNASALSYFTLNVTNPGRAPKFGNITPTSPYNLLQGQPHQVNISAWDLDKSDDVLFSVNVSFLTIVKVKSMNSTQNATAEINFTPTDAEVGIYDVLVTIEDQQLLSNTTVITYNITNINDPPVIYENSYNHNNTVGNNISSLTGYAYARFIYYVNASDPDVDSGDSLNFTTNTSLFDITSSGKIVWLPDATNANKTYDVNITVIDSYGLNDSITLTMTINNNTPPYWNDTLPLLTCNESLLCQFNLSDYAFDNDTNDSIANYTYEWISGLLGTFALNQINGTVLFIPQQTEIGNYTANMTIADTRGALASTLWNITILNVQDTPVYTRYDFSNETIVATHYFEYQLQAVDNDLLITGGSENLTFSSNTTWIDIDYQNDSQNTAYAMLSGIPGLLDVGDQDILLTVNDSTGRTDTKVVSITVLADSNPPHIFTIKPYGNASDGFAVVDEFINTSDSQFGGGRVAQVVLSENTTYNFAHYTVDDLTPNSSLTFAWYIDGQLNSTGYDNDIVFGYFASGDYDLMLAVSDDMLETSYWNWSLEVQDLNRPPVLRNALDTPVVINSSTILSNYFYQTNTSIHFIDPDDDLNSNGVIDANETDNLQYTYTPLCSHATITINGADLELDPLSLGTCSLTFTALDSQGEFVQSDIVVINVSLAEGDEVETQVVQDPSGGGGSSSTRNTLVPITRDVEIPEPISIIAPKLVSIYNNKSVTIPVEVTNNWKDPLEYITLAASTNVSDVQLSLTSDIIETLAPNETKLIELTATNYRLGENYEVVIAANVSEPAFSDSAEIVLATIEHSSPGAVTNDVLKVKVTFARDLFNENPECLELNELLDKANEEMANNRLESARIYVDTAINGCKYVVSQLKHNEPEEELPKVFSIDDLTIKTIIYFALAFIVIITVAFIIYYHYTSKEEDDI